MITVFISKTDRAVVADAAVAESDDTNTWLTLKTADDRVVGRFKWSSIIGYSDAEDRWTELQKAVHQKLSEQNGS